MVEATSLRGRAAVYDDGNAVLELVAHRFGGRTFGFAAEVGGGRGDGNAPPPALRQAEWRSWGTRSATFPVLAVTFNGRREDARIIMVSGPGQNLRARA